MCSGILTNPYSSLQIKMEWLLCGNASRSNRLLPTSLLRQLKLFRKRRKSHHLVHPKRDRLRSMLDLHPVAILLRILYWHSHLHRLGPARPALPLILQPPPQGPPLRGQERFRLPNFLQSPRLGPLLRLSFLQPLLAIQARRSNRRTLMTAYCEFAFCIYSSNPTETQ